jgi:hypothetical protein
MIIIFFLVFFYCASKYQWVLLEAPYMSYMSHNNGAKIGYKVKYASKSRNSSIDTRSSMSGLNLIGPRLMNTLMKLVFVSEA